MLKMHCVADVKNKKVSQNLQNIRFNELFQMYVKQKSVEYSTCGIR